MQMRLLHGAATIPNSSPSLRQDHRHYDQPLPIAPRSGPTAWQGQRAPCPLPSLLLAAQTQYRPLGADERRGEIAGRDRRPPVALVTEMVPKAPGVLALWQPL